MIEIVKENQDKDIDGSEIIIGYLKAGKSMYRAMGNSSGGDLLEFAFTLVRAITEFAIKNFDKIQVVTVHERQLNPSPHLRDIIKAIIESQVADEEKAKQNVPEDKGE